MISILKPIIKTHNKVLILIIIKIKIMAFFDQYINNFNLLIRYFMNIIVTYIA